MKKICLHCKNIWINPPRKCTCGHMTFAVTNQDNKAVDEDSREIVLLKACLELLQKCEDSTIVLDASSVTVFYDGADCDGYCLKEDIESFLECGH